MTNDNTRPDNTPHTHHTRVYSVHSKVKTMPISMVPECPHFQGLNGCSTRIKSILPSLFQSTIRGRRKSVRFAVTRSKGLSSTSRNWPSESWRKWIMGCAKSAIRRSNRPSWSQSATLKCPQPRTPLMRRKGFSFKALSLQWTSTPNKTSESDVFQHSTFTNLCPSQFFLEVQCCSHSTSHPFYLPEAYPVCHRRWCQELRANTQKKIPSCLWKGWVLSSQNSLDLLAQTSPGLPRWLVWPTSAWNHVLAWYVWFWSVPACLKFWTLLHLLRSSPGTSTNQRKTDHFHMVSLWFCRMSCLSRSPLWHQGHHPRPSQRTHADPPRKWAISQRPGEV